VNIVSRQSSAEQLAFLWKGAIWYR